MQKWIVFLLALTFGLVGCNKPLIVFEMAGSGNPAVETNPQGIMAQPTLVTGILAQPTTTPGTSSQPTATPTVYLGNPQGVIPGSTEAMPCESVPGTGGADGQYLLDVVVTLNPGYYIIAEKDEGGANKLSSAKVLLNEGFVSDANGLHWWTYFPCSLEKLTAERNKFFPQSAGNN